MFCGSQLLSNSWKPITVLTLVLASWGRGLARDGKWLHWGSRREPSVKWALLKCWCQALAAEPEPQELMSVGLCCHPPALATLVSFVVLEEHGVISAFLCLLSCSQRPIQQEMAGASPCVNSRFGSGIRSLGSDRSQAGARDTRAPECRDFHQMGMARSSHHLHVDTHRV